MNCEEVALNIAQRADLTGRQKIEQLEAREAECGGSGYYEYYLGQLYGTQRRYPEAIDILTKAARIDMPLAYERSVRLSLADAYHLTGDIETAMSHYSSLIESYPEWAYGQLSFGVFLLDNEAPEKAITHLENANSIKPNSPKITRELATAYYFAGQPEKVIKYVGKTHELIGNDMFSDRRLVAIAARAHLSLGEVENAENVLGALINADPEAQSDELVRKAIALVQKAKNPD